MIDKKVLKAFGFRRAVRPGRFGYSRGTYYQPKLELYYDAVKHSDHQFVSSMLVAIVHCIGHATVQESGNLIRHILPGGDAE